MLEAFILIMNQVYRQFIIIFLHLRDHISYVDSSFIRSDLDVVERTVLDEIPAFPTLESPNGRFARN